MLTRLFQLVIALSLFACASNRAIELYPRHQPTPQINNRYVFLIILDGPRVDDMEKLAHDGKLPTIQKTFFEKGARYQNSTAVFPTSSASGHQAIMTGLLPGRNGIPALSWLDRSNKRVVQYLSSSGLKKLQSDLFNFRQLFNPETKFSDTPHTLYTALAGHPTFNCFEQVSSGATQFQPKFLIPYGWEYAMAHNYEYIDAKAAEKTIRTLSKTPVEKFPRLTATAFYALDMTLHYEEPTSERVVNIYQHIDTYLSELQKTLEQKGILDRSIFILTGDHGFHVTQEKVLSLKSLLAAEGITATEESFSQNADAFVSGRAIASNVIFLKKDGDWGKRVMLEDWEALKAKSLPDKNILDVLLAHPGIEWILGKRQDGSVEARSKKGSALIRHTQIDGEDFYQYEVPAGSADPFQSRSTTAKLSPVFWQKEGKLFEGGGHPDALVLASSLFDDGRGEGIYVALDPGWNIRKKKLGNHGSYDKEDIRVPLWFSGAGIKPGEYSYARTVDIYPTVATLFGLPPNPHNVDGRILTEILSHPPSVQAPSAAKRALAAKELDLMRKRKFSSGGFTKNEVQKELARRLAVEKNIQKWEEDFLRDYGALTNKSSAKARKVRELLQSLQHAKELASEARARMEKIIHDS